MRLSSWTAGIGAALLAAALGARAEQPLPVPAPDPDERFTGVVAPGRQVTVAAPLGGILTELDVEEGDQVEAGAALARLDDEVQTIAVGLAELEVSRQQMMLDETEIQYERMEQLLGHDAAQEWEVRRSRLQRDAARVAVERAREDQKLEQVRLARHTIRAPFAGHVVRVTAEEGAFLQQGEPMLSMVSLDPLEAQMYLPVELYGRLVVGDTYPLRPVNAPTDRMLEGRLKMVEPLVDSASRTFRCVFTIENPGGELPAGFTVHMADPEREQAAQ